MKPFLYVALPVLLLAQEPKAPADPINMIRADLAIAQRDYERVNAQCQVQVQASDQAKRLITLLKAASEACQNAGQTLDADSLRCVSKAQAAQAASAK